MAMRDQAGGAAAALSATPDAAELRSRYRELFEPVPRIYWTDMLASAALGWGGFAVTVNTARWTAAWFVGALVAVLALYRAVLFIHELAHLRRGAVPGFEVAWSLLVGFPLLAPSLLYVGSHGEHHRRDLFGTADDPEYQDIGRWSLAETVCSVVPLLLVPPLLVLRWGLLGPLSWMVPPLRSLVVGSLSTLVINPAYRRRMPEGRMARRWLVQEACTAAVCWGVGLAVWSGALGTAWLVDWSLVMSSILVLNHVRTLVAHRYENDGRTLDLVAQYRDSVNISGGLLDLLMAPVGLRFHALHHLLPSVPYHSLGAIHRGMVAALPATSPYRESELPTMCAALRRQFGGRSIWRRRSRQANPNPEG